MDWLSLVFKTVSVTFALSAVGTGLQAIIDPVGHSSFFGLPVSSNSKESKGVDRALTYVSVMGFRQLATGVILLVFAVQRKWPEVATILAIIGLLVAGTDGYYIAKGGSTSGGVFHALPGSLISALACGFIAKSSA